MRRHLVALVVLLLLLLSIQKAVAASWVFQPSQFSHNPETGERVGQYAPKRPAYVRIDPTYRQSGYRHHRQVLRGAGGSVDRRHIVETWGDGEQIRPYGEWLFPFRAGATPYGPWGNPQGPWTLPFESWVNPYGLGQLPYPPWGNWGQSPYYPSPYPPGGYLPGHNPKPVPHGPKPGRSSSKKQGQRGSYPGGYGGQAVGGHPSGQRGGRK